MWLTGSSSSGCRITNCLQSNPLIDVTNITVAAKQIFTQIYVKCTYVELGRGKNWHRKELVWGRIGRREERADHVPTHCEFNFVILRLLTSLNIITKGI